MGGSSRAGWTSHVSRRSFLALPAVLGLAGCSLSSQYAQDHDPYLQAMKKDPMATWEPPMAVARTVYRHSRDEANMEPGSAQTEIWVRLTPADLQALPDLLAAAKEARAQAGFSERNRRYGGRIEGSDFWFECEIHTSQAYRPDATPRYSQDDELVLILLDLRWEA